MLSFTFLEAPLIRRCLIGLTSYVLSTIYTAMCKGVNPFESLRSRSLDNAKMKLIAFSDL